MTSRFPFPVPDGWFQVAITSELKPGDVLPVRYFERDFVIYRTEDGAPAMLDAYCPHLGAHLGHGGTVRGDSVVCPFHAWAFNTEGKCTDVPYGSKIPKKAAVGSMPLVERNGMILAWHHGGGEPPQWQVPALEEFQHEKWTPYVTRTWTVSTCNQEMAENAVDKAHFQYLHGTVGMPTTTAETKDHVLHMKSEIMMTTPMGEVPGAIESHLYGFGFTTTRFTGLAETLLVSSSVPVERDKVNVYFNFTVKKMGGRSLTEGVAMAFMDEVTRQLEQDIPIWENKRYLNPPVLCDGDGPIGLFRKWSKQFYS